MTSNEPDRSERRARHAQRVNRIRSQRNRQPANSAYATAAPFAVVGTVDPELAKAEEVFPL